MEYIILIFISLLFVIFSFNIHQKLARRFLYIILVIWMVPLFVSISNPYGLYKVSITTYMMIIIGIMSFNVGYSFSPAKHKFKNSFNLNKTIASLTSKRIIVIIFFICFSILLSLCSVQFVLISSQNGLGSLKLDFFELIFNNNSGLYFLYQVLICPLFYLICMVAGYQILNGYFDKRTIIMLLYVFSFCYLGGKRGYFAIFLEYLVVCLIIKLSIKIGSNNTTKRKTPVFKLIFLGFLLLLGAGYMTMMARGDSRDSEGLKQSISENIENTIIYNIGPYRALDYAINNDFINKYGAYTLGRSTLGGMIDYYGSSVLNMFGFNIKQARSLSMLPLQDNSIVIGKDRDWNFSYTSLYYFIFDFGYLGIFIFPFIFGLFVRYSINIFLIYKTLGALCLVGYLFIACCLFNCSWFNISLYAQPTIIFCLILHYYELKRNKQIENTEKIEDAIQYYKISSN